MQISQLRNEVLAKVARQYNEVVIGKWKKVNFLSNFQIVLKLLKCSFMAQYFQENT